VDEIDIGSPTVDVNTEVGILIYRFWEEPVTGVYEVRVDPQPLVRRLPNFPLLIPGEV
jgi:hypothetical protein